MKPKAFIATIAMALFASCSAAQMEKDYVDYVNPYIGNISHLLVPTFPTVQLPNSMLRVYPERSDFTSERVNGLPVVVTNHRERSAFKLIPTTDTTLTQKTAYNYDDEKLTPYSFEIDLNDNTMHAKYALSHHSAVYEINFKDGKAPHILIGSENGALRSGEGWVSGWQTVSGKTKVYLYLETKEKPAVWSSDDKKNIIMCYDKGVKDVHLRYGISFISEVQAKKNLREEISDYDLATVADKGRKLWNETLGRIQVEGGSEDDKVKFYSSYYRTFERPICMSEDGKYWSAWDNKVHEDSGVPFYTDDWIWDTYRAAHPLRALTDSKTEENILASYLLMCQQDGSDWMPTFPEVNGDSRRMNSNHGVVTFADAAAMGLKVDVAKAYEAARRGIEEKTLAPWSGKPASQIDAFYKEHGYIPALDPGEKETDPVVNPNEKRQPVAVTLGTSYDEYCLALLAKNLGKTADAQHYLKLAHNYRNLYNAETGFFHPKDKDGKFIEPLDYSFCGGMGARDYYDENNGWEYRWDVPHNVADLIHLMGGRDQFIRNLDQTFAQPLGRAKYEFYAILPDHTGNVGQFSMANEPGLHIPYLYNYAGAPWKTQKRIRQMLKTWFRNDLMGMPGDEDGGGMTSFVVFSMLGFYPVTPGTATYNIGSPVFSDAQVTLSNGKTFRVVAEGASDENKYIQSAKLNGKDWNQPWFRYGDIKNGGTLELKMGSQPNKQWGSAPNAAPPSIDK